MPAPIYVGDIGGVGDTYPDAAIGASSAETGILLDSFDSDIDPSEVAFFDIYGAEIGYAKTHAMMITYTVTGEIGDIDAGVFAATFTAAATLANENMYASTTQTFFNIDMSASDTILTGASFTSPRGNPRAVTLNYKRPRGFAV